MGKRERHRDVPAAVPALGYENERQGMTMSKKLVYVSGSPFWMTPEGAFEAVERRNGRMVERVYLRTPQGLHALGDSPVLLA